MGLLDEIRSMGYEVRAVAPVKLQDTGCLTDEELEQDAESVCTCGHHKVDHLACEGGCTRCACESFAPLARYGLGQCPTCGGAMVYEVGAMRPWLCRCCGERA